MSIIYMVSPSPMPKYCGKIVMEVIYEHLDPDVAKWSKEHAPKPQHGQNYHQWLTAQFGLKKLIEHIWMAIRIAKTCRSMSELKEKMAQMYGKIPVQLHTLPAWALGVVKPRHAAALALVVPVILLTVSSCSSSFSAEQKTPTGWRVMAPANINDSIPNAKWTDWSRSFDSAPECEVARTKLINGGLPYSNLPPFEEAMLEKSLALSQCLSSDDPRLKGN